MKNLTEYLASKGIKDVSKNLEDATELELMSYYTAKLEFESIQLAERIQKLEADKGNETLAAEVEKLRNEEIQTLRKALFEQGKVLSKVQEGQLNPMGLSHMQDNLSKVIIAHKDDFSKTKEERHSFKFEIATPTIFKAVGDMTLAGNVSGGTMPQAQRLEGVNDIAERAAITYSLIPKLTTDRNTIEWVYESGQEGTIDGTAEGATKDQVDNNFVVTSVALVKRAAYFKVSTEMLDDVSFMAGWLRNKLILRLLLDVDNQVLNGNATAPNLKGILAYATTFSAGTFAGAVDNANDVDSLVVAMNQIKIANQLTSNLTIELHPSDVTALKLIKVSTTDKRYVDRLMMVGSTLTLDGVPIVENVNITQGTFLVGDFSKATIVQKSGIMVEVGFDGNDFTKNMRTILAEWRGQLFVQNNDTTAFVKGTFATTNAALETT